MLKKKRIILASSSPRRRELLALTKLKFDVVPSNYEEEMDGRLSPLALARHLSLQKAKAAAAKYRNAIVISADTFIVCNGRLLGKPHMEREAIRMLRALNGKSHSVITGFTVIDTSTGKSVTEAVRTKVYFRKLNDKEITAYVKTKEPLDKAGGYAIQGLGSLIVKRIEGDYYNVIGLPLCALTEALKKFGIYIL